MRLVFPHSRDGLLVIDGTALATMRSFEQHASSALEAGGLLFGRLRGHDVVIKAATTPSAGDVRSRFNFDRLSPQHGAAGQRLWTESGGTVFLVGDWHTHAQPIPVASPTDLESWQEELRRDYQPGHACFFVIVGTAKIAAWEGDARTGEIRPLRCAP